MGAGEEGVERRGKEGGKRGEIISRKEVDIYRKLSPPI